MTAAAPDITYFHSNIKRKGKNKSFYLGSLFRKGKHFPQSPSADFSLCLTGSHAMPNKTFAKRDKTTMTGSSQSRVTCWGGWWALSSLKKIATWRATNKIKVLLEGEGELLV